MKFRFFTVSVQEEEESAECLNRFLSSHRIVSVDKEFVQKGPDSFWAFCVGYTEGRKENPESKKGKIDYREVLGEKEFTLYAKLRALRKAISEEEGVPPYALFTNQQLAEMVQRRVTTNQGLKEIEGIGDGRIAKYGKIFLSLLEEEIPGLMKDKGDETE